MAFVREPVKKKRCWNFKWRGEKGHREEVRRRGKKAEEEEMKKEEREVC